MKNVFYPVAIILILSCSLSTQAQDRLHSSDYHQIRGGLSNCKNKFEQEKQGRVAFLGGSITRMSGWRDSICVYLEQKFPGTEFDFIHAGIGSYGSTAGAFRLERDVLSFGVVDLLFQEAAVNDRGLNRTKSEQIRGVEGIVRHASISNPYMDIVIMHFVDQQKMSAYREGLTPEVISNHEQVASWYNIPTINLAKEVTDRIDNGEFSWEDDFKNLHPSPFGQGIYAASIIAFLEHSFNNNDAANVSPKKKPLPEKLDPWCYDNGYLVDISGIKPGNGWYINPIWAPGDGFPTRPQFLEVPMLISETATKEQLYKFKGKAIGMVVDAGPDAGSIEYKIDRGKWLRYDLRAEASKKLHLPRYITLASELDEQEHVLRIRLGEDANDTGCLRIRYFYSILVIPDEY
ncbi:SGNH/GDSL hydrolase family protein [Bacteroidota bacterium]